MRSACAVVVEGGQACSDTVPTGRTDTFAGTLAKCLTTPRWVTNGVRCCMYWDSNVRVVVRAGPDSAVPYRGSGATSHHCRRVEPPLLDPPAVRGAVAHHRVGAIQRAPQIPCCHSGRATHREAKHQTSRPHGLDVGGPRSRGSVLASHCKG